MNNLTYGKLKEIWDGQKNLTNKPIFIDFYGNWCAPCKMFKQVLDEVTPEYRDRITFYKVDIDEEIDLANIFQIKSIPHFVTISKDGGVSPGGGAMNKETLKYFLEGLLLK